MAKANSLYKNCIKRVVDFSLSAIALIVLSPILLVLALLVRIKLGSPILFTQKRIGKDETEFKLYKFRTMTDAHDERGNLLPDRDRMTKFGGFLRSTSLDELPELINILRGDMAVVGPRPLHTYYLPYYTDEQLKRHSVRPGLTGYAQIHGRNAISWDEKLKLDIEYVNSVTFLNDIKIIIGTIGKVFKREGINSSAAETMEDFRSYCKSVGREPRK